MEPEQAFGDVLRELSLRGAVLVTLPATVLQRQGTASTLHVAPEAQHNEADRADPYAPGVAGPGAAADSGA